MNQTLTLREKIIHGLSLGPRRLSLLVAETAASSNTTIQGVYKALRTLKKEEIVTIHKHTVSLSIIWVEAQIKKMEHIAKAYKVSNYIEELRQSKKGRTNIKFSTFEELDLFWTHFYIVTEEGTPLANPLYMVIPHDWFLYLRRSSDTAWVNKLAETKRFSKMLITHAYDLDKKIISERKKVLGNTFEYGFNHNPYNQKEEEYYNIVGNWVFIARMDKTISNKIYKFLKTTSINFNEKEKVFLNSAIKEKGKFTLTIIHSETKATALKNKLRDYFT